MPTFTKWDYELAARKDAQAAARREHDEDYQDIVDALDKIGIDPRRLKEYLDGLPD